MAVFLWVALARKQFTGLVCLWELRLSPLVAHVGEKADYRPCVWWELSRGVTVAHRLKDTLVPRLWGTRKKIFFFLGLVVHAAVRGGTCAFTLLVDNSNTVIKNSSRNDRPSIST